MIMDINSCTWHLCTIWKSYIANRRPAKRQFTLQGTNESIVVLIRQVPPRKIIETALVVHIHPVHHCRPLLLAAAPHVKQWLYGCKRYFSISPKAHAISSSRPHAIDRNCQWPSKFLIHMWSCFQFSGATDDVMFTFKIYNELNFCITAVEHSSSILLVKLVANGWRTPSILVRSDHCHHACDVHVSDVKGYEAWYTTCFVWGVSWTECSTWDRRTKQW